jgi:triacylglycerol lipase
MRLSRSLVTASALVLLSACGSITDPLAEPGSPSLSRKVKPPKSDPPPPPPPPAPARTPILFVHGWNSSGSVWTTMVGRFKTDGWTDADLATFSYYSAQSNATTAAIIQQKVDSMRAVTGAARVSIITHSMGSLSARYYVRNLGGDGKVDALISLGGPNHGTSTANYCLQTACFEMRVNSTFLNALNSIDETWGTPRYATWRSPCDEVINPQSSPILDGATNTQTACMLHSDLYKSATVYAQVRDWVQAPVTIFASASMRD